MLNYSNRKRAFRLSPPQTLALGFIVIILIGSVIFATPSSNTNGEALPFLDAMFIAASAACVTGLSVINVGMDFTTLGQVSLMVLIQVGGLGFTTMATLIAIVLRRRISFRERLILQEAMNQTTLEGIIPLIKKVMVYSLVIEAVGAILLASRFMTEMPVGRALYFGLFHSISIFNNAGFDLFGMYPDRSASLIDYAQDPFISIVSMILIVLGGLGFIVLSDLITYRQNKRLTLHSKVVLAASAGLIVFGTIIIFIFEYSNPNTMQPLSFTHKLLNAMMQSVSSRSAGVSTVDIGELRQATQFAIMLLMFVGAAPGSTGGGIKVTTLVVLIFAVIAMLRGREDVVLFRRRLDQDRIHKAITFTLLSFFLIVIATMVLTTTESAPFLPIMFEVTSAFATAGMSTGITDQFSSFGKAFLIVLMFVGRLGPVTLAFALARKPEKDKFRRPEGRITIG
ncbi:TrkH family potassium uptake protein [Paenibacillus sp. MMS18-CY102]|uniref:TrkH family potassium uptake protein n=1 Tax=Paenibacillus sp. MMS18-CY102 TaxID=2682849 RepID=UPI0013662ED5|nr:TrkH family potassium uptake protein [Paenibacillus sp. MMS18-CY102]MWC26752.1 Trk family potassium uptake protein [Paenibacillus sp. MMS18-CY102]